MIVGNLNQLADLQGLASPLVQALDYLKSTDLSALEVGRYELDGDNLFVLIQEMTTQPVEERRAESHELYVDIQCLIKGHEVIGYQFLTDKVEVKEDMRPAKDVIFYQGLDQETMIRLAAEDFAIFYPSDIHRPGCIDALAEPIKKAVVKIKYSTLV